MVEKPSKESINGMLEEIHTMLYQKLNINDIKNMDILTHEAKFRDLFKIQSLLGIGSFGVVLEVKNKLTEETSALKVSIVTL